MKKLFALLTLLCVVSLSFAQSKKAKSMLDEIETEWKLDNNNNISFIKTIDVPGVNKQELYNRVVSFFTYNYNSGDDVIQDKNPEQGFVIAKGIYQDIHTGYNASLALYYFSTVHIIRIDVKDEKIRVIITLLQYNLRISDGDGGYNYRTYNISELYPIQPQNPTLSMMGKTMTGKAFYSSYQNVLNSFDKIEKTVNEGSTGNESTDW